MFTYRFHTPTKIANSIFKIMHLFSSTYSDRKENATTENARLSRFLLQGVVFPYKLSNKFIEDFERIMDFVEHKHIVLKTYKVGNGIKS